MKIWLVISLVFLSSLTSHGHDPQAPCDDTETAFQISSIMSAPWLTLGYLPGKNVPSLTLFTTDGKPFNLWSNVEREKPLLVIAGSYTCDISRGNLPSVEALQNKFGKKIDVLIVYTIDAHPYDSPSPYSPTGEVALAMNNIRDNVKAPQPKTYLERVELAKDWKQENAISVPLLVDNPQNDFWRAFGQGPNMCYLIDREGKIDFRELWFDEKDAKKAIRNLLNRPKY
jgi:hypothetical protein